MSVQQITLTIKNLQKLPKNDIGSFLGLIISLTDDTIVFESAPDTDGDVTGVILKHNIKNITMNVGDTVIFNSEGIAFIDVSNKPLKSKTTRATGISHFVRDDLSYRK